jgi:hypothetical protein
MLSSPPTHGHGSSRVASVLGPRSAPRLAWLFVGAVLDRGWRTVTSWIRAAGLSREFRPCDTAVSAAGKRADSIAARLAHEVVNPLVAGAVRLTLALDDTPTERYGRHVQGAGVHHDPCPRPAGSPQADPSVHGQGQVYLGYTTVVTDSSGNGSFAVLLPFAGPAGWVVSATATAVTGTNTVSVLAAGDTSEFSADLTVS